MNEQVAAAMQLADAALALAGHQVTDPVVREIGVKAATGEITGDEAARQILQHHGIEADKDDHRGAVPPDC